MDKIRALLERPAIVAALAFIAGLLIGLVVLGWWIWPVQWTDAAPAHLQAAFKEDYLRMAIDSYTLHGNVGLAQQRYQALGEDAEQILDRIRQNPGEQSPAEIEAFAAVLGLPSQPLNTPTPGAEATPQATTIPEAGGAEATALSPTPTPTPAPKGRLGMLSLILILCGLLVILIVIAALVLFLRQRMARSRAPETPFERAQAASREAEPTDFTSEGREPPLAQFMATYMKGDDLFDDSFSVDSPSGEFLGECGVGIADTIGVGEPKKVIAFEVWLFDKNDIQTVTKVLMSEHAFNDEATRQRLATKGEPVLAEVGKTFVLETETLQMVARVVDMEYGDGALPENSYFERLTLELAVWRKEPVA